MNSCSPKFTPKAMAGKKVIAICQLGGIFKTLCDGSLSYDGGEAHAIDIDEDSKYNDFYMEVAEMFNCIQSSVSIKYFLPGNRKTLITISNDKDLQRMIKFHENSSSIDVYIMMEEVVAPDVSNMPASRSSRTTLSEAGILADTTPCVLDDDMDEISPRVLLDSTFDVPDDLANADEHIVNVNEHMGIASEIPLSISLPLPGSSEEKHIKAAQQWQNKITGTLLAATAPDGDDDVFPVAFAVVDTVSDDNWLWFLQQLKASLTTCHGLTIVADREKGLKESISGVFHDDGVYHAYCVRFLSEQLIRDLKGQFSHEVKRLIVDDLYAAAYAPRPEGFQKCIESIKKLVHPIPSEDKPLQKDFSQAIVTVTPPPTRRLPGRPPTKKLGTMEANKRQLQCSRCKCTGHNKSTCKEFI
ncbi:hypothetical protein L1987_01855 [Smallanthus sonchifolius]|uniref:Uncharacterized protein n=1 Tax=Smallanthus sonchifolius TaxID=185202 RepID=A0ACB9K691_9ASTR|nr:hypothetical protein L1987_01855 [Smallanthus sonchifolius]